MENTHSPAIGVRWLSRRFSWIEDFGKLLIWACLAWTFLGERALREESFQFDSRWWFQLFIFAGCCFLAWWNHSRLRPYLWKEAFEEGDEWVFRRGGEELRIFCGEVEQVAMGATGLLILRLRRGSAEQPLILFPPARNQQDGLSVYEYLGKKANRARRKRQEKAVGTIPIGRERLSSNWTFVIKYLLPWVGLVGLAIWVVVSWGGMAASGEWSVLKVGAPLLLALVGFIFHHEYLSNLADEIFDEEDALSIRHLGREHRVPFSDVKRLDYRPFEGFHWVVLHLKTPHPLGEKIAFIPKGRGSLYGWNPRLDALADRIGQT